MGEVVFLDVPYQEKDEAKRLGARWDPEVRKWYVPEGRQLEPFSKWLPDANDDSLLEISAPIYVVESSSSCWSCGSETSVPSAFRVLKRRGVSFGGYTSMIQGSRLDLPGAQEPRL